MLKEEKRTIETNETANVPIHKYTVHSNKLKLYVTLEPLYLFEVDSKETAAMNRNEFFICFLKNYIILPTEINNGVPVALPGKVLLISSDPVAFVRRRYFSFKIKTIPYSSLLKPFFMASSL